MGNFHRAGIRSAGEHPFVVAQAVVADEAVGGLHHRRRAAEILLHLQKLSSGVDLGELQKGLRVSPPEGVDALVFIPHQKEVALLGAQLQEDGVL